MSLNEFFMNAGTLATFHTGGQNFSERVVVPENCEAIGIWLQLDAAFDAATTVHLIVNDQVPVPAAQYITPATGAADTGVYIGANARLGLTKGDKIHLQSNGLQVAPAVGWATLVLRR